VLRQIPTTEVKIDVRPSQPKTHLGLVLLIAGALAAAACSSSSSTVTGGTGTSATEPAGQPVKGGDLVFGAEQEGDCMDWIGSCASGAWGVYTAQALIMPRAFDFTDKNDYKVSTMLAGEPTLETSPKQKITYKISDRAVWSDGQPMISQDFKYTWDQVAHGTGITDTTGYASIEAVDTPDPKTAVVTFKENYPAWRDLFGGYFGVFPSHILEGKDRNALMKDGYDWSGGPWKLKGGAAGWVKGTSITLVPNDSYYGEKPNLSSITFKFLTDTKAEQDGLLSNQVAMIYPQAQPGQEALAKAPGIKLDVKTSLQYEALWFNTQKEPFTSKAVRQAVAYAIDRDAIVKQLFAPIQPDIKRIDSFSTPAYDTYSTPFSKYSPVNEGKVTSLMTGDGWAKGPDGIWAKGGRKASFEVKSTTGNDRRALTLQILQSQLKTVGFDMTIKLEKAGDLFGTDLPAGQFTAGLYAQNPQSNDPALCSQFCSKNIPGPSNNNAGQNYTRMNDPAVDGPWLTVDSELDVKARAEQVKLGAAALAEAVPGVPIDPFPDIIAYSDKIQVVGGGGVKHNLASGPWYFANTWFLKK